MLPLSQNVCRPKINHMNYRSVINKLSVLFIIAVLTGNIVAQNPALRETGEDFTWWYIALAVLVAALAITVVAWTKKKKAAQEAVSKIGKKSTGRSHISEDGSVSFDADAELEWLRKNHKTVDRTRKRPPRAAPLNAGNQTKPVEDIPVPMNVALLDESDPPVFEFKRLESAAKVDPLPLSNDEDLLGAIEQSQDEYEEDEEVRELSMRILAAFRTRNSVEALSQIAIYDLSSGLRSKAVSILSEINHESVFESILLACADPTREVRAAAARAFSRLSFDRADAWDRIIETGEQGRMVHAARAALEGGFVERSFDRLTHRDKKYAYEAFALVALLVRAGEVQQILETIRTHRDMQVRRALIHVLSAVRGENAMSILYGLLEDKQLPDELKKEVDKAFAQENLVTA